MSHNTQNISDYNELMEEYGPNTTILSVKPIKISNIYISTTSEVYLTDDMRNREDLVKYIESLDETN